MGSIGEKVVVVGLGYIGLPTASLLATRGFSVLGVDVSTEVVETINRGEIHIVEPDLDVLVRSAVNSGQLRAALVPAPADVFILAVPTPFQRGAGDAHIPDVSYVEAATRSIAPHLAAGNLVILESTSPVGTTEKVRDWIYAARPELRDTILVAHCPERVLPGYVLKELVDNDRIVGGVNAQSTEAARAFYAKIVHGGIFTTDSRTAELCKLVENSFRDTNIAFANELSLICDRAGIDVWELITLANKHPRVNILMPGPGVGGHCIAVDPWFIIAEFPEQAKLIKQAREVNNYKPHYVIEKVKKAADRFKKPVIACLGVAFKADIDDLRESPALEIVRELEHLRLGEILVSEPNLETISDANRKMVEGLTLLGTDEAIVRADIVLLLVNHREFYTVNRDTLREKVVIDTRGVWR